MRLVILESPYRAQAGEDAEVGQMINLNYLQACIRDCLKRGDAPFASHQMYTLALRDDVPEDRELGMRAGFDWHRRADATVVYDDRGISAGMSRGIQHAKDWGLPIEFRQLGEGWMNGISP